MSGRTLTRVATACVVATMVMPPFAEARADEPTAESGVSCEASFEAADLRLRPSESRLLDGRAALRGCSLPTCKAWMIADCSKRLAQLEGRIPSVALSAEDARGTPLYDVRVLEGENELVGRLNGVAVEMDPGLHELVAERNGTRVGRSVVVIEGKKAQQLVFTFGAVPSPNDTSSRAVVLLKPSAEPEAPAFLHPWARPFAGGLFAGGVLALGTGAVLGAIAVGKKQDARCDAANVCDGAALDDARSFARSANVALGLGAALAVGGAITFLAFGRTRVQAVAALHQLHVATTW